MDNRAGARALQKKIVKLSEKTKKPPNSNNKRVIASKKVRKQKIRTGDIDNYNSPDNVASDLDIDTNTSRDIQVQKNDSIIGIDSSDSSSQHLRQQGTQTPKQSNSSTSIEQLPHVNKSTERTRHSVSLQHLERTASKDQLPPLSNRISKMELTHSEDKRTDSPRIETERTGLNKPSRGDIDDSDNLPVNNLRCVGMENLSSSNMYMDAMTQSMSSLNLKSKAKLIKQVSTGLKSRSQVKPTGMSNKKVSPKNIYKNKLSTSKSTSIIANVMPNTEKCNGDIKRPSVDDTPKESVSPRENILSLRWENCLANSDDEEERLKEYKMNRRKRYLEQAEKRGLAWCKEYNNQGNPKPDKSRLGNSRKYTDRRDVNLVTTSNSDYSSPYQQLVPSM